MVGIGAQIEAFLATFLLGIGSGIVFHYYQLCIRKARVNKYSLYLLDFFLWIFMVCAVFLCMLLINNGEMRIYVLIALLVGIIAYYQGISRHMNDAIDKSAGITVYVFAWLNSLLRKPFIFVIHWFRTMVSHLKTSPPPDDGSQ